MITLRKLESLKEGTRQRKCALLLKELELILLEGRFPDTVFFKGVCTLVCRDLSRPLEFPALEEHWLRYANDLRHDLLKHLGQEPSDWDFTITPDISDTRQVLPISLYLDDIRSPFNLGSIFRTAEALGVKEILLSPGCTSPEHPRAQRTAMGAVDILPWRILPAQDLTGPLFAMECGGTNLQDFSFPSEGTMVVGSEELGVSPELLKRAEESLGRVSITMRGIKGSINVGVATGILLDRWCCSLYP
ncbi:MAG: TrmH family RNA methyltransferase [Spirochaetaceae bacterium]|jgi:TrmH family RNA methyltransferase|nr:TrmH family RNA methyltransferase [Spirochaetaceae bacterium]